MICPKLWVWITAYYLRRIWFAFCGIFSFGTVFMLRLIHMSITKVVLKVAIKEPQDPREMVG